MPDKEQATNGTKFIILARKRTGSTMLRTALDNHPQAVCFGEILRKSKPISSSHSAEKSIRRYGNVGDISAQELESQIVGDPDAFLDRVLQENPDVIAAGLKLFPRHQPAFLEKIMNDSSYVIIYLKRDNYLATYSSQKLADSTGVHNSRMGNEDRNESKTLKIRFDPDDFQKYWQARESRDQEMDGRIENASARVYRTDYQHLVH